MWPLKMKATECYLPIVPFIILYKEVFSFDCVDELATFKLESYKVFPLYAVFFMRYKTILTI